MVFLKLLFVIIFLYKQINCQLNCNKFNNYNYKYNLLRHCQRSNKTIIALGKYSSVEECSKFAQKKRGLAFNYNPIGRGDVNLFIKKSTVNTAGDGVTNVTIEEYTFDFYNCHVLGCPEIGNFTTMINDTRYDYYSLYSNKILLSNITCIPTVGLFVVYTGLEMKNYSEANEICRYEIDGAVAHVLSETRTNLLSKLIEETLNDNQHDMAFIGLERKINATSWQTSIGEPIDCFRYRAWAPGHPPTLTKRQKVRNCIAITKQRTWKAVECSQEMSFVCEIFTKKITDSSNRRVSHYLNKKCSINKRNVP